MSLPEPLRDLEKPGAYPHPCRAIELVETHASWVLLTGDYVYKLKKPVRFSFLDFSTLERREHFCREELRCNRRFAPSLYLDVVPIGRGADGSLHVGMGDPVVEWAVKMHQFPKEAQLDRLMRQVGVTVEMLFGFGRTLAAQHRELPVYRPGRGADVDREVDERVLAPARDNYRDLGSLTWTQTFAAMLRRSRDAMERQAERQRCRLRRRVETGCIRECHGDLHLSNLVLLEDRVTAFDCLEFNPSLRWIDPVSDVAFLFMDCLIRERPELGYAFVDGYLDEAGDYQGATLLPFYAAYRSMVRAKVAALEREQEQEAPASATASAERFQRHARWAAHWLERPPGRLFLMCGLSGSGKSYLAERLVPRLPALRLRSDVARKVEAGLSPREHAGAAVGSGLYQPQTSRRVYRALAEVAEDLLRSGEHVIVDAAFLNADQREHFAQLAAGVGSGAVVVYCRASRAVLEARLRARTAAGRDPSDADLDVLEHQMHSFVAPGSNAMTVDTERELDASTIDALTRRLMGAGR